MLSLRLDQSPSLCDVSPCLSGRLQAVLLTLRFSADRLHAVCVQSEVRYNLVGYFPGTIYFTLNTVTGDIVLRQSFANDLYSSLLYVVSCVPNPHPPLWLHS